MSKNNCRPTCDHPKMLINVNSTFISPKKKQGGIKKGETGK
jgi:hypothetical protein